MFYLKEIPFVIKKSRKKIEEQLPREKSIIADFQYHILTLKNADIFNILTGPAWKNAGASIG